MTHEKEIRSPSSTILPTAGKVENPIEVSAPVVCSNLKDTDNVATTDPVETRKTVKPRSRSHWSRIKKNCRRVLCSVFDRLLVKCKYKVLEIV